MSLSAVPSSANSSRPRTGTRSWRLATRDPAGGRGEPAEVPDDRPSLEVRDDADERQAREQPGEEPVARARVGGVDHGLPGQDGKPRRRHSRQPRRNECAIARAVRR